jgi:hypothetical protein
MDECMSVCMSLIEKEEKQAVSDFDLSVEGKKEG